MAHGISVFPPQNLVNRIQSNIPGAEIQYQDAKNGQVVFSALDQRQERQTYLARQTGGGNGSPDTFSVCGMLESELAKVKLGIDVDCHSGIAVGIATDLAKEPKAAKKAE